MDNVIPLTLCHGTKDTNDVCPKREDCIRYKTTRNPQQWEMYYVTSPWFNGDCPMFEPIQKGESTNGNHS
jgi:hypothetical protein